MLVSHARAIPLTRASTRELNSSTHRPAECTTGDVRHVAMHFVHAADARAAAPFASAHATARRHTAAHASRTFADAPIDASKPRTSASASAAPFLTAAYAAFAFALSLIHI